MIPSFSSVAATIPNRVDAGCSSFEAPLEVQQRAGAAVVPVWTMLIQWKRSPETTNHHLLAIAIPAVVDLLSPLAAQRIGD